MAEKSEYDRIFDGIKAAIDYVQPFVVIYVVSLLEIALQDALISKMRPLSENFKERILKTMGHLAPLHLE